MDPKTFHGFRELAYAHAGIAIRENKQALVSARVAKRVRTLGLGSESQYLEYLRKDTTGEEMMSFLDVISTNFTSFFREQDHFEVLKAELVAMTLAESLDGKVDDWRLLATDISIRALEVASAGRYELDKLEQVPRPLLDKYFKEKPSENERRVTPALRDKILFKRLNLATPPFPLNGNLDVVFCRNVMIYFDLKVRQRLISEIERLLKPGGLLLIAHSETLNGITCGLGMLKPSVYRKGI
jgi:chemotaxis protein methyltransferase CheR